MENPASLPTARWYRNFDTKSGGPATNQSSSRDGAVQVSSIAATKRELERFMNDSYGVLTPHQFGWQPLRTFLGKADIQALYPACVPNRLSNHCLFDRRYSSLQEQSTESEVSAQRYPDAVLEEATSSMYVDRQTLSEPDLLHKLASLEKDRILQRTVFFFTNITPVAAVVVVTREDPAYMFSLRRYIQCHVAGHSNEWPRHLNPEVGFVFEFHLSYVAIREAGAGDDPRRIRQSVAMIEPLHDSNGGTKDIICYDAQISCMVIGKSDKDWKAYCNVDTWYGSEQDVETYLANGQDAPSGGARRASEPCWNPREYFLLVLCQRFRQTSMEWGNTFTVLMARLDTYENCFLQTIDTAELFDDESMSRTRSYSKAASMLRQYHDTLATTIERLEAFLKQYHDVFQVDESFDDQCGCVQRIFTLELTHLKRWRRRLFQRMQRFDVMRDGLLTSSVLRESRRSSQQGADIGVLTNVTVMYLPFSLASGIFGLSDTSPAAGIWIAWAVVSTLLGIVTFWFAFCGRLKPYLRQWLRTQWR